MTTMKKICDLCGGTRFEVICRLDRRGRQLDTVLCSQCGLVGHAVVPTEAELDHYYAAHYRKEYHGERQPSHRRVLRAWLKGQRILSQLRPFLQSGSRIFEVGAGLGCTVKVFDLAGHDASGLEPGNDFQDYSARQLRAKVHHGTLRDFRTPEPFDMVLFIHVLEHLPSPRQALNAIHRLLKPGGKLYLECPSLGKLSSNLAELFHCAHIHTFTPVPLLTLLKQCGFVMERCFSDGIGSNHKFLLARTDPISCPIDPAGVDQTREFAARFQAPWHRLSLRYLAGRCRRISTYAKEYLCGAHAVRHILKLAQQSASQRV